MITRHTRCPTCTPWCATTEKQFADYNANMRDGGPFTRPHACPECGSIDWATSREMIGEPGLIRRGRSWWRRIFG